MSDSGKKIKGRIGAKRVVKGSSKGGQFAKEDPKAKKKQMAKTLKAVETPKAVKKVATSKANPVEGKKNTPKKAVKKISNKEPKKEVRIKKAPTASTIFTSIVEEQPVVDLSSLLLKHVQAEPRVGILTKEVTQKYDIAWHKLPGRLSIHKIQEALDAFAWAEANYVEGSEKAHRHFSGEEPYPWDVATSAYQSLGFRYEEALKKRDNLMSNWGYTPIKD
jgi:hypothetical protein